MAEPMAGVTERSDHYSSTKLTNESILAIWKKNNAVKTKTNGSKIILSACGKEEDFCNHSTLKSNLQSLIKKEAEYRKTKAKKDEFHKWLQEPYQLPTPRSSSRAQTKPKHLVCNDCPILQETNLKFAREVAELQAKLITVQETAKKSRQTPQRKRQLTLDGAKMSSRSHLLQAIQRKQKVIQNLRRDRRDMKNLVAAKDACITKLKCKLDSSSDAPREAKRLRRSRHRLSLAVKKARNNAREVKSEKNHLTRANTRLHQEVDCLNAEAEELKNPCPADLPVKADEKTYSPALRQAMYKCLENQVPVESASSVVSFVVSTLTDFTIKSLPDKTTVSQMAYEMGVLSDLRVAEVLVNEKNLTLAWDATSLDGSHINEIHVSTQTATFALQIDVIPGGKTDDYVDHITTCLQDITEMYAKYSGRDEGSLLRQVHKNISNTLSDRVAVNHCVVERLNVLFDSQLLELKCNLHPLDGLANAARQALKKFDREQQVDSSTFGSDCRAANFIYSLSKMRYKQGVGDPQGFKVFLRQERVPYGWIVRYVGNRLHVLFHLAGVFFCLRKSLLSFLQNQCIVGNSLRPALVKDYQNPVICMQLRVLGLLGKVLTGPWMRLFYTSEEQKGHLDKVPLMKRCVSRLVAIQADPSSLLQTNRDVFGQPLTDDPVLQALQQPVENAPLFKRLASLLLEASITLLKRQLDPYLTGPLSKPSRALKLQAKSAPAHNIFAEQTLGMTDAQSKRAPNATIGFIDGKVKFKKNHVFDWLSNVPEQERVRQINFAVGYARYVREKKKERSKRAESLIASRRKEKTKKRDVARRRAIERKIKAALGQDQELVAPSFLDVEANVLPMVLKCISNPNTLVDHYITHVWEVEEQDIVFNGHILELETTTTDTGSHTCIATIVYWKTDENEADGVEEELSVTDLIADLIFGELIFDI